MEIHSRYYSATENQSTTSDFDELSNRLFRLMKENRIKDVLSLFQSVPSDLLYRLVNEQNSQYDNDGPLNFAIKNSANHLVVIMLLRLGARISENGDSALFTAVRAGLLNLVKILLISGANVNVLDPEGYSILHWACFRMNTLMVRLILQVGNFALHNNDRNKKRISPLGN
jgi:ankyrin repeat protein